MSTLTFDAAGRLPAAKVLPIPAVRPAARANSIAVRVAILTAISLILCSVPDDGGPFQARPAASQAQTFPRIAEAPSR